MKQTDMEGLKQFCKDFFDAGNREADKEFGIFLSHTYTNNTEKYREYVCSGIYQNCLISLLCNDKFRDHNNKEVKKTWC